MRAETKIKNCHSIRMSGYWREVYYPRRRGELIAAVLRSLRDNIQRYPIANKSRYIRMETAMKFTPPTDFFSNIMFQILTTGAIEVAIREAESFRANAGHDRLPLTWTNLAYTLAGQFAEAVPNEPNGLFVEMSPAERVAGCVKEAIMRDSGLIKPFVSMVMDGYRALPGQVKENNEQYA